MGRRGDSKTRAQLPVIKDEVAGGHPGGEARQVDGSMTQEPNSEKVNPRCRGQQPLSQCMCTRELLAQRPLGWCHLRIFHTNR